MKNVIWYQTDCDTCDHVCDSTEASAGKTASCYSSDLSLGYIFHLRFIFHSTKTLFQNKLWLIIYDFPGGSTPNTTNTQRGSMKFTSLRAASGLITQKTGWSDHRQTPNCMMGYILVTFFFHNIFLDASETPRSDFMLTIVCPSTFMSNRIHRLLINTAATITYVSIICNYNDHWLKRF